jgi:hypothetical protein
MATAVISPSIRSIYVSINDLRELVAGCRREDRGGA